MTYTITEPPAEASPTQIRYLTRRIASLARFADADAGRTPAAMRGGLSMRVWTTLSAADRALAIERYAIEQWRGEGTSDAPPRQPAAAAPAPAQPAPRVALSRWTVACGVCGETRDLDRPRPTVSGMCPDCRDKRQAKVRKARADRQARNATTTSR